MALKYTFEHECLHYISVDGARYQIAEEPGGGLMVRLVEADKKTSRLRLVASASNTFHLSPNDNF